MLGLFLDEIGDMPLSLRALFDHLPGMLAAPDSPFRPRIARLPDKIKWAILAVEIAVSLTYTDDGSLAERMENHLRGRCRFETESPVD